MRAWSACLCSTIVRITIWSATEWCMKDIGARSLGYPAGPRRVKKRSSCATFCSRNFAIITFIASTSSTAGSVRLIREARARGVKISGEICPHHIALTDEAIQNFDTNYKMNPPLRSQDRCRCAAGGDRRRNAFDLVFRSRAARRFRKGSRVRCGAVRHHWAGDRARTISRSACA